VLLVERREVEVDPITVCQRRQNGPSIERKRRYRGTFHVKETPGLDRLDGDVIDLRTAFSQQLLHISV
jgi:hypothetical protein